MKIAFDAKCSDLFNAIITEKNGTSFDYYGYPPYFLTHNSGSDCISLEIDLETGQILNWKKVLKEDIEELKEYMAKD